MHWVDCYYLETWYRKYITLTYFFQFCPDKTGQNWEKTWKMSEMVEKIIIKLNFLQKIICIWLIGTV